MALVEETRLPGIGVRYEFTTTAGDRIGVIHHRSGRRELVLYDRGDPDTCRAVLPLAEDDAHSLVELLGGSEVVERLDEVLRQSVEGLTLEWVEIQEDSPAAGRTLAEIGLRSRTGASIVAIVREGETVNSPRAEFRVQAGDTAVVVGSPEVIEKAAAALRRA
jgi:TrkA domain protein